MKKNLKKAAVSNYLLAYTACLLLLAQTSYAGIRASHADSSKSSSGSSSSGASGASRKPNGEVVNAKTESCDSTIGNSKYFPLKFFSEISRDGSTLQIEKKSDNQISVKFPYLLKACGSFKVEMFHDDVTKNETLMVSSENGMSYNDYVKCLKDKTVKDLDGKDMAIIGADGIDHKNIALDEYIQPEVNFDYKLDKEADGAKSIKLSFGSSAGFNIDTDYQPKYGLDEDVVLPSMPKKLEEGQKEKQCMRVEKIQQEAYYLNEGREAWIKKLSKICNSGTAQEIADARKAIGNADVLKDLADKLKSELDAGYLVAVKDEAEQIRTDMRKIEDKFISGKSAMTEAEAKKNASDYADLSEKYDKKFINPAIVHLDNLMRERADVKDNEPRAKEIDGEIKKINDSVSDLWKKSERGVSSMYPVMEKYGLTDSARTIEDIRLKSRYYGQVYAGAADSRGKPITFEQAKDKQYNSIQKFNKVLGDWQDEYDVSKGSTFPLVKTQKERTAAATRMNKRWYDYQTSESTKYQKYCGVGWTGGVNNPVQCKEFMSGVEKRRNLELKRRDKDLAYIKGRDGKLAKMSGYYSDYQRRKVAEDDKSAEDEYGASDFNLEDDSGDSFMASSQSTAYDPSLFNMGGQQAAMNMGNMGMNNPMMVNPQMPVAQGQYQMGAWPTIH